MELAIQYIQLISWLIAVVLVLFQKNAVGKLIGSILIAYVTLSLFTDETLIFGSVEFLFVGMAISLTGIIQAIKKYL